MLRLCYTNLIEKAACNHDTFFSKTLLIRPSIHFLFSYKHSPWSLGLCSGWHRHTPRNSICTCSSNLHELSRKMIIN